ncbi:MAG: SMC-Scp complex subunit ScpB [Chloroflexi bacterium]|nr:SMC-Scp complex subunit ScpB [Chloroflexota bacterium]
MPEPTIEQPKPLKVLLESLLFVAEGPVAMSALAQAVDAKPEQIELALDELKRDYEGRGFRLQRARDKVQLVTAPDCALAIEKFLGVSGSAHLSAAAFETVAIIAYRQPVTRPAIEAVRGVNCDGVIHSLLARGLIEEVGRQETAGRPILYATTFEFLQNFGLRGVDELPPLEQAAENQLAEAVAHADAVAQHVAERMK